MKKRLHLMLTIFAMVVFLASGVHVTLSKCHSAGAISALPACCEEQCGDTEAACEVQGLPGDDCCTLAEASFFVPVYGIDKVHVPDPASGILPVISRHFSFLSIGKEVSFSVLPALKGEPPAASISQLGVYRI